jgi:hypothetical protein
MRKFILCLASFVCLTSFAVEASAGPFGLLGRNRGCSSSCGSGCNSSGSSGCQITPTPPSTPVQQTLPASAPDIEDGARMQARPTTRISVPRIAKAARVEYDAVSVEALFGLAPVSQASKTLTASIEPTTDISWIANPAKLAGW